MDVNIGSRALHRRTALLAFLAAHCKATVQRIGVATLFQFSSGTMLPFSRTGLACFREAFEAAGWQRNVMVVTMPNTRAAGGGPDTEAQPAR